MISSPCASHIISHRNYNSYKIQCYSTIVPNSQAYIYLFITTNMKWQQALECLIFFFNNRFFCDMCTLCKHLCASLLFDTIYVNIAQYKSNARSNVISFLFLYLLTCNTLLIQRKSLVSTCMIDTSQRTRFLAFTDNILISNYTYNLV